MNLKKTESQKVKIVPKMLYIEDDFPENKKDISQNKNIKSSNSKQKNKKNDTKNKTIYPKKQNKRIKCKNKTKDNKRKSKYNYPKEISESNSSSSSSSPSSQFSSKKIKTELKKSRSIINIEKNNKEFLKNRKNSIKKSREKEKEKKNDSIKLGDIRRNKSYISDSSEDNFSNQKNNSKKEDDKENEDIFMDDNVSTKENELMSQISQISSLGIDYLPCREKEQERIYDYIKEGLLTKGNYSSLYIAGMPGTGKTACVKRVLNILESEITANIKKERKRGAISVSKKNCLKPFNKLFISGTEFPNISNVFKKIYQFIFSPKKGSNSTKKYISILDNFFSNRNYFSSKPGLKDPSNSHIVLIIDEIDFLINKAQKLLYNIFNWTTYEGAKLIVISISNTLDFPNHLLPKIKSRMGQNKIMFKPYNKDELRKIIKAKGIDLKNYSEDALKLSCMKVAAVNGDLRRIFQILKKAKEINDEENNKKSKKNKSKVSKNQILLACDELFNSKIFSAIKSLQIAEKIIIATVLMKMADNNNNRIKIEDLFSKKDIFVKEYNSKKDDNLALYINWEDFQKIVYNLLRLKILSFAEKPKNNFLENNITVRFYIDEFISACEEDEEFKQILELFMSLMSK